MNFLQNMGGMEWIILLVIVLIIFGPKRLPGLGKAVGKSIREFKDGMKGIGMDDDEDTGRTAASISGSADSKPAPAAPAPQVTVSRGSTEEQAKPS